MDWTCNLLGDLLVLSMVVIGATTVAFYTAIFLDGKNDR